MLRLLRQISYRQLRASWGRTALVVGGIAVGISLIVAINVINTSVLASFRTTLELIAGPAELEVVLGVGEVGFSESAVEIVKQDPEVLAAVPLVRGTIALADEPGATLQLFGADLLAEEDLDRYHIRAVTGRREASMALLLPRSIFFTTAYASAHDIGLGDVVRLATPRGIGDFTVRGLLETEGLAGAFGGQIAVMDLPAAQLLLEKEGRIDQIDVILRPDGDVAAARRRLEATLPSSLSVVRPAQRGEQYEQILASFQAMLTGLSTLCLIAGIFIVYNTTSTGAAHRALAMASLRLVGADARRLFRLMMLEALILGVVGTLIGMVLGIVQARILSHTVTDSMGIIFQMRFPLETLAIDVRQQATIFAVGIVGALVASYFAARRVADLEPLEVLRADARSTILNLNMRRLGGWWLAFVALSAASLVAEERFKSIAWGNLGSTLWNASAFIIAIPLVAALASVLSRILPRFFGAEGRVATESLFRSSTRTGVTVAAIALVMALAITVSSLVVSSRISIGDYVEGFLSGDLVVSAIATEGGWLETPLPESVAAAIRDVEGVRAVETGRVIPGHLYRGQRIALLGLSDGMFEPARYPSNWFREGDAATAIRALRAGVGVTISTGLADRTDLGVGDRIELETPTGPLALPVLGVVPDYVSDRGSVILNRRLLVERWDDRAVSRINVFLEPGGSAEAAQEAIVARVGRQHRLKVLPIREVRAYHEAYVDRAFAFTASIQLLIIIVTVAGIFDLLVSTIVERRRELSLWRLVGADEHAVRRSVVIESATIGTLGALLGIVVGIVTAWIWVAINFRYLLGYYLEFHLPYGATAWYTALVLTMTILTGYAAARQATGQPVLEGLRAE